MEKYDSIEKDVMITQIKFCVYNFWESLCSSYMLFYHSDLQSKCVHQGIDKPIQWVHTHKKLLKRTSVFIFYLNFLKERKLL